MHEQYHPPTQERRREEVLEDIERIAQFPDSVLKPGPAYQVETKMGERLLCETLELDLKEANRLKIPGIKNPYAGDERMYLIAKDAAGNVVGTRFTTLFMVKDAIEATSFINVIQKGKGYASPIEEAFQRQLQDSAEKKKKAVVWKVTNQNLERLEEYRKNPEVDEHVLRELELEQSRWQSLYGTGGKLGIEDGKKTFEPTKE